MKIHVTKDDITNAIPYSISSCPIARAFSRYFNGIPQVYGIHCDTPTVSIINGETECKGFLSRSAERAARKFDKTGMMEPFTFEIDLQRIT